MKVLTKAKCSLELEKEKTNWKIWFLCFLVFCFIGWIYEILVFDLELGYGFVNRGFLFGPWLPVYGAGGMLIILSMRNIKLRKIKIGKTSITPVICFFAIILLCTTVELITSYAMELATGSWLWDYTNDFPNFQGRIALKSSVRFGIIGIIALYGIWPELDKGFKRFEAM
ncbi:MAG: putative ABC transporter permease [Eubacteriaceae bacterium]|nr:putative ABC transporter permease [Eubacteriaceae bacterium]